MLKHGPLLDNRRRGVPLVEGRFAGIPWDVKDIADALEKQMSR